MHTTIRLHRHKWRSVYHNEVLAHGLAARDAAEYQAQRLRWGTGAMQILRLEHPLTRGGLSLGQRLAYAATLLGWFDAWRTLAYVLLPLAVIFSGLNPIRAPIGVFLPAFLATFCLQRLATTLLSRGYAPQGMAAMFEFVRMQSNIRATLMYFHRGEHAFKVTAKDGNETRRRIQAPWSLWFLIGATLISLAWFGLTIAGLTPLTYRVPWTAYGAAFWSVVNLGFLTAALNRIRSDRFASERRGSVRLQIGAPANIEGRAGHIVDVSMGGALVQCTDPPAPSSGSLTIEFQLTGADITLTAQERGRQVLADGSALIRLHFEPDQVPQLAGLATALFGTLQPSPGARDQVVRHAA
jgi:hypothetical protein